MAFSDAGSAQEPDTALGDGGLLPPVPVAGRTFSAWDMASLWVGLVVNVTTYYLAGSLVDLGMSWWQGVVTVFLGNLVVVLPLVLVGHGGTCYGVPFAVQLRSAFGVRGACVPAVLRAIVACGWCGIETWIGGQALYLLLPRSAASTWWTETVAWLGTSVLELLCFILFLALQLAVLWKGMNGVHALEKYSSPALVLLTAALFAWAYTTAGGFGSMLSTPSHLDTPSQFLAVFLPSLTGCIGSWSGLALSISDFTRYARSQRDQVLGQLGLPVFMGAYTFAGLAITSATEVIFGRVISNPINLLAEISGGPAVTLLAIVGISLATVTTNIPANFVAPANVIVSLAPSTFSFFTSALLTGIASIAFLPWRIMSSSQNFVYTWLVGYSAILAPVTGIIIVDYYVLQGTVLDVKALYSNDHRGRYYYTGGYNLAAFVALAASVAPTVPGFLHKVGATRNTSPAFAFIYDNSWFFAFFSASAIYWLLSSCHRHRGRRCCGQASSNGSSSLLQPLHGDYLVVG